jgi:adenylate kinase
VKNKRVRPARESEDVMRVILLGPPGSGKGTQAKLLSQRQHLCHFSTGDILREAVRNNTPSGLKAQAFMAAGQLVPDEIVNEIVAARFRSHDRPENFVMDGYPRTLAQALTFDDVLKSQGLSLDAVVNLVVDDAEIISRLGGRWTCPNPACKATYHMVTKPPKRPGFCDECGTALVQREDDKDETIRNRLAIYHVQNDEILNHYRRTGLLAVVPGKGDIQSIYASILAALKKK